MAFEPGSMRGMMAGLVRGAVVATALGTASVGAGVTASASDYPPREPSTPQVDNSPHRPQPFVGTDAVELPQTGGHNVAALKVAGLIVLAGAGMVVVGTRRRASAS